MSTITTTCGQLSVFTRQSSPGHQSVQSSLNTQSIQLFSLNKVVIVSNCVYHSLTTTTIVDKSGRRPTTGQSLDTLTANSTAGQRSGQQSLCDTY